MLVGVIVALVGLSSCGTSIFSILPFVLSELLGPENVKTIMGFQYFFQGLGVLAMMFSAGLNLKQYTSEYFLCS